MKTVAILTILLSAMLISAENVLWMTDGKSIETAEKKPGSNVWYDRDLKITALPDGGFQLASHANRYISIDQEHQWLVFEITGSEILTVGKYSSWSILRRDPEKMTVVGNVRAVAPGLYTLKVPSDKRTLLLNFYLYNLSVNFKYLKLVDRPENFLEALVPEGKTVLGKGDVIRFVLTLKEPCEDVTFQLFYEHRGLSPFNLNGTNAVNLKPLDDDCKIWGAEVKIQKIYPETARAIIMKATVLGGKLEIPLWGRINMEFRQVNSNEP